MIETVIEMNQVSKRYKNTDALQHINLSIKKGEIFGLIGENGAGKTTLMKILCGLVHANEGDIKLFGKHPNEDIYTFRRVGALIEDAGLYPSMNAYENMKTKALAYGCFQKQEIDDLLEMCGLSSASAKKVKSYSLGMKQRLGLAMALLGNPELLILDEPTNGLDPQGINDMRVALQRLNKERKTTILVSSHILEELSKISTSYGILQNGKLVECLSKEDLMDRCQDYQRILVDNAKKASVVLEETFAITNYEITEPNCIHIFGIDDISMIIRELVKQDISIYEAAAHKQTLESYFLNIKGGESHVE